MARAAESARRTSTNPDKRVILRKRSLRKAKAPDEGSMYCLAPKRSVALALW